MLRLGSLFSGAGLGDYGLELAGFETVFQVESDLYCQKVLEIRWPSVPKWWDVRDVHAGNLPACDVLAGGFPCQDLSVAGKRAGIDGSRSGLWSEFARLIGDLRPRYVIVENVAGLLERGFERVLGDLAARGYDAEWESIPASALGAPHRRDRVWVVAYPTGRLERAIFSQRNVRRFQGQVLQTRRHPHDFTLEPRVDRVVDGVPFRVDRVRAISNGQVVQVAQWVGDQVMRHSNGA